MLKTKVNQKPHTKRMRVIAKCRAYSGNTNWREKDDLASTRGVYQWTFYHYDVMGGKGEH